MQQTKTTTLLALAAMAVVAVVALMYYNGSKSKLLAGMDMQQDVRENPDTMQYATVSPATADEESSPAPVTGMAGPTVPGGQPPAANPSELLPAQDPGLSSMAPDFKALQGAVTVKGANPTYDVRGDITVPNVPVGPFLNSSYDGSDYGIRYGGVCA